jgi:ubiquinone/menaquinone biosynthesis C-methylase UbiE
MFIVADAAATGLREASMDGAISIDAIQLMSDQSAVLAEIGRIVKSAVGDLPLPPGCHGSQVQVLHFRSTISRY